MAGRPCTERHAERLELLDSDITAGIWQFARSPCSSFPSPTQAHDCITSVEGFVVWIDGLGVTADLEACVDEVARPSSED
jgi:hypothetical protein